MLGSRFNVLIYTVAAELYLYPSVLFEGYVLQGSPHVEHDVTAPRDATQHTTFALQQGSCGKTDAVASGMCEKTVAP